MKSKRKIKNKRAQAFLLDIIVGILFFTTALMFYFKYSQNINTQNQEYELMMLDANYISNNLLSDGSPNNWEEIPLENLSKEIIFGITNRKYFLNETKISYLETITNNNYSLVKQSFETPYDFYIIIEKKDSNITFGKNYANAKTLVKTTRFLFYNGSIIKMHLYVFY
ncbi:MAG: hypothetical protein QXU20_01940 [Candidatus Woesearchaeota archaeon]